MSTRDTSERVDHLNLWELIQFRKLEERILQTDQWPMTMAALREVCRSTKVTLSPTGEIMTLLKMVSILLKLNISIEGRTKSFGRGQRASSPGGGGGGWG